MSVRHFLAACLTYAAATAVARAQPADFACPKAGTVEQRAVSTLKYTGASPGDAEVCTLLDAYGKPALRLFNLYTLSGSNNQAATTAPIRAGLRDLLSGRKTSASFPYTATNGYIQQETWTFQRKASFEVNGQAFDSLVFNREISADPRGRSNFHGRYVMWFAPKAGLWVKSDLSIISGSDIMYPKAYTDHVITLP